MAKKPSFLNNYAAWNLSSYQCPNFPTALLNCPYLINVLSNIAVCLGATCIGLTLGWPEISITYNVIIIKCTDSCYDLSRDGSSTIHLIINLGSCLGALVPACLVDITGRRHNFCISAIASIVFWVILGIATDNIVRKIAFRLHPSIYTFYGTTFVIHPHFYFSTLLQTLMLGAAVGGFSAGLFIVTSTMYVSEVSSPDQRGTIGSLAAFFAYLGILISTSLSTFYNHRIVTLVMGFVPICFLLTIFFWMIESPYFLYENGKVRIFRISH